MVPSDVPRDVLILTPCALGFAAETLGLWERLAELGWARWRCPGSDITQLRSAMASKAITEARPDGSPRWDYLLWLDADMGVSVEQLARLVATCRELDAPDFGGVALSYVPKVLGSGEFCLNFTSDAPAIMGQGGSVREIAAAGFGVTCFHRRAYERVGLTLPRCWYHQRSILGWPFHASLIEPANESHAPANAIHHGEDFAFFMRAKRLGLRFYCDTRERIRHWGAYPYQWEDAAEDRERFDRVDLNLTGYLGNEGAPAAPAI